MKTIVLNTLEEHAISDKIGTLVNDANMEVINTSDMNIAHCMGCNLCWLKTPGICAIKDDYEGITKMGQSFVSNGNFMTTEACKFTGPEKNPWIVHLLFRLFIKRFVRKNFEHFAQQWGSGHVPFRKRRLFSRRFAFRFVNGGCFPPGLPSVL